MLQPNKTYTVRLIEMEQPKGKNMRTLVLAIDSEKEIHRGVSFFFDNPQQAITPLEIWARNIVQQTESEKQVPTLGNLEYEQKVEGKHQGKDIKELTVQKLIKLLDEFADGKTTIKATYQRKYSAHHKRYFNNMVPYQEEEPEKDESIVSLVK